MKITWRELAVDVSGQLSDALLSEWRWMVAATLDVRMVSALGDAFLESPDGAIFWLDVAAAELTRIAISKDEFEKLCQIPENVERWFMPQLVGGLLSGGSKLDAGECFSYKISPSLGGTFEPSNFEVCKLSRHFVAMGKIQAQVKHLPVGTRITSIQAA